MRGVRGSKRSAAVQPFYFGEVAYVGRGSMVTVTGFELKQAIELAGDELYAGFYVLELITRLLVEGQSEPEIFLCTVAVLRAIQRGEDLQASLRRFELELLHQLGFGINFMTTIDGQEQELRADRFYRYEHEVGFTPVAQLQRHEVERVQVFAGSDLLGIQKGYLDQPSCRRAAKQLMRAALQPLLGPKPLISRAMFTS